MIAKDIMRTDFLSIDGEDTVAKLISNLKDNGLRAAVVLENGSYLGIVYSRLLLRNRAPLHQWKVKHTCARPGVLSGDEDIIEVAKKMFVNDVPMLPVINHKLVGVVLEEDLLKVMRSEFHSVRVKDIMTDNVFSMQKNDKIAKVLEMMHDRNIERIPIVDSNNVLIGITSLGDVLHTLELADNPRNKTHGKASGGLYGKTDVNSFPVLNSMQGLVWSAKKDQPLIDVIDSMILHNIMCVPVIDAAEHLIGIFTIRDLMKKFYKLARPGSSI